MNLPNDQFSVKFYLARLLLVIPYIKKNYKFLFLGVLIGATIGGIVDYVKSLEDTYEAEIIFTIESPNSAEPNGLSSLLGLAGGNESSNIFSGGNFEELVKLNFIYDKAFLSSVKSVGVNDVFINYFLKKYDDKDFDNFRNERFPANTAKEKLSRYQIDILNIATNTIKSHVTFTKENEKSSFRKLKVTSNNDTLSYLLSNTILKTFTDIYIKNKTKKSTELVTILQKRVDSLRNALYYTQGKLASFADQNQQIIFQSAKITADRLQMNSTQIQGLYNEAVRNLDSYKFSLVKETPLLNIISQTELPIFKAKYKFGIFTFIGLVSGLFVSILVLYLRKVYLEIFND